MCIFSPLLCVCLHLVNFPAASVYLFSHFFDFLIHFLHHDSLRREPPFAPLPHFRPPRLCIVTFWNS